MPKGQSPKIKGSLCNIPIQEVDKNRNSLPIQAASNDLIIIELKPEKEFRGHVILEAVRPNFFRQVFEIFEGKEIACIVI